MNHIRPSAISLSPCPAIRDPEEIAGRYANMLADESRLQADLAKAIYFPRTVEELAGAFRDLSLNGMTCIISGGRTGITGGAVPLGTDAVVSLERMKRILDIGQAGNRHYIRVEAGVTLKELEEELTRRNAGKRSGPALWFPLDPTERTAQLGGMAATNASGPRTFRHGGTRRWVRGTSFILPDGRLLNVRRGDIIAEGTVFRLTDATGSTGDMVMPRMTVPVDKCTAGYFVGPGMDLIDLLVGSEGTLGAFAEVELWLAEKPETIVGILAGIKDEETALHLVDNVRHAKETTLQAIEYFDPASIRLVRDKKREEGAGSSIPDLPFGKGAAVYFEIAGPEKKVEKMLERLERLFLTRGLSPDHTWAAREERDRERQRVFRHAIPEAVNAWIARMKQGHPGLHKVGTDFTVPDEALRAMFSLYREGLEAAGLQSVIFGHIGNNHVHVNVLPRNMGEMDQAWKLYRKWAEAIVRLGGAVSGEHGIGRLKKDLLEIQYPAEVLEAMRRIRRTFDLQGMLAPGVMF